MSLLTEFSSAFSKDENDLGWTDIITHSIDTGDSKPVANHYGDIHAHIWSLYKNTSPICFSKV